MKRKVKIEDLKSNPENPRLIKDVKFNKLVSSLREFPEMLEIRPIIIDEDNVVLGGNMRLKAAIELGLKEVWIDTAWGLNEEQKKEFIIKDNSSFGEWDWEVLANEWNVKDLDDWGLDLPPMFDEPDPEAKEDDYVEPNDLKVDVVLGDLIEIGDHRLLCGDSTNIDDWEKIMEKELADLVVTDPPYNVDYTGKTKDALKIINDKKTDDDFYSFLLRFYTSLNNFVKKGGAWYVWHADSEGANFRKAMVESGILLKQCLIWVKNSMVMGRQDYHWQHEPCLYGWKEGASHNWYSDRKQTTILNFDRPTKSLIHPTMKPVELIAYQIENSSKMNDIVCDGFLGGGSTMVASHQLKRKCYGMELDPKYCQVIIDRMQKLEPNIIVKINGKEYI
jgi:site-specific DNA-methyltransferase (adenine-specific)